VGLDESFAAGSPTSVVFAVRPAVFHHAKEQPTVAPVHPCRFACCQPFTGRDFQQANTPVPQVPRESNLSFEKPRFLIAPILLPSVEKKLLNVQQFAALEMRL
jgi:hypothetical protein